MALKYKLVQKGNPSNPAAPKKFFASAVNDKTIGIRRLSDEIANISTVSPADTVAVIECLIRILPEHVSNGEMIKLGDFGTFSVNVKSQGAETAEAFTHSHINGVKIIFRPGKVLKHALAQTEYQKV